MKDEVERFEPGKHQDGGSTGKDIHAASTGKTNGGCDPHTSSGGKSTNHILALMEDDGARTDETDTRDDLCLILK